MHRFTTVRCLVFAGFITLAGGCALFAGPGHDQRTAATLSQTAIQYLYPSDADAIDAGQPQIDRIEPDRLELPLKVGLAFVPHRHQPHLTPPGGDEVLTQLATLLREQPYIGNVVRLPRGTLTPSGGFSELDRAAFMHQLDTILLISYEQVAYTADLPGSMLDLTIVGAFIVPGHSNEIHTRLTATAIHIPSRRYLLSADGTHSESGISTLVHSPTQIRTASQRGMPIAAEALQDNLALALADFKQRAATDSTLQIAGGALGLPTVMLLALLALMRLRRRQNCHA